MRHISLWRAAVNGRFLMKFNDEMCFCYSCDSRRSVIHDTFMPEAWISQGDLLNCLAEQSDVIFPHSPASVRFQKIFLGARQKLKRNEEKNPHAHTHKHDELPEYQKTHSWGLRHRSTRNYRSLFSCGEENYRGATTTMTTHKIPQYSYTKRACTRKLVPGGEAKIPRDVAHIIHFGGCRIYYLRVVNSLVTAMSQTVFHSHDFSMRAARPQKRSLPMHVRGK